VCDPCPFGDDADNDGVCSDVDNCPGTSNTDQNDIDADGRGDVCDCDRDGDGVGDKVVYTFTTTFQSVFRHCGVCVGGSSPGGNSCDLAVPSDCSSGGFCAPYTTYCPGITCNAGANVYPACGSPGAAICIFFPIVTPCCLDNCQDLQNADQTNSDNDLLGDACDPTPSVSETVESQFPLVDLDGDSRFNASDNCFRDPNYAQDDIDLDQLGDVCDADRDGDGVLDVTDNCRVIFNLTQVNNDLDGFGDACDNCPFDSNHRQTDSDFDGLGDSCDTDDERITLHVDSSHTAAWELEVGYTNWILLRGDLAVLRGTGAYVQSGTPLAAVDCNIGNTADVSGIALAPGEAVFFLAGGFTGGAEDGFGNRGSGTQRIVDAVCE
jgi:hypothetical protein